MSTELESAKLFANYFQEEGVATEEGSNTTTTSTYAPPQEEFEQIGYEAKPWPGGMTCVTAVFYILGVSGLIGGLYAMRNLANLEATEIIFSKMANYSPEAKYAAAMLAAQVKYSGALYCQLGLRVLVGCAFFGAGSMLAKRTDGANNIAILVCGLAIFYNLVKIGVSYLTISSITDVPGVSAAAAEASSLMGLGFAGCFFLLMLGVYCGLAYYLSRPSICALFEPKPKKKRRSSY